MLIVHLVVAGIFLVLGTVFAFGKGAFLIAGYNTASAEEKAKYDEKKLCRAVSKLMLRWRRVGSWRRSAKSSKT